MLNTIDLAHADILFTDVDDTLTTQGRLLPETYWAICRLASAGIRVIPVTGGCAGWCDQIIRTWPVTAVIGEGGAFYAARSAAQTVEWHFWEEASSHRHHQSVILDEVAALDLGFEVTLASDQAFRFVDVAIDYNQQQSLNPEQVAAVQNALLARGFNVRQSSIHLNVWQGDFDKATMALRVGRDLLGLEASALQQRSVFIGDAPNDECMFRDFPLSIGVANIRQHLPTMTHKPAAIAGQPSGLGFAEMAEAWLQQRTSSLQGEGA
ncbi:haloacid dehalogenase [Saccharospirillum sp. MSK14-1]|uniref:HAD-IIB family hydrolase n=1 Tax=Saccharospirillum sp. MSK14-1 TaxID=1897632 RepID=UPI000D34A40B|nr:HAD-IIB family hydrolase [Saccharospirillum sp. MSK14-1]PTY36464.1 haloacid dehalogenase [Saccharospirillum sp. MSK14-1]